MDLPPQQVSAADERPRLRRLLNFGDVLDESMFLFRRHWITFALVSSVSLLPPSLVLVWLSGAGLMSRSFSLADLRNGGLVTAAAVDPSTQLAQSAAGATYFVIYS